MRCSSVYRVLKVVFTPVLSLFFRIDVKGEKNVPTSGRFLLCSNHISNSDPILLAMIVRRQIFFMAKEELFKNKVLGRIIKVLGAFPVRRGRRDTAALSVAQEVLRSGNILGIFIEGRRSKTGELLKPKPGAAVLAGDTYSRVVPVFIRPAEGCKVRFFRKVIVRIGEAISPDDLNLKDKKGDSIRAASRFIMSKISKLKDESYN